MPVAERAPETQLAAAAAAAALGLGLLGAVMMVVGHQPWEGPLVVTLSQTHGIHLGDAAAVGPLLVGMTLARWCWRSDRRRHVDPGATGRGDARKQGGAASP